MYGDVVMQSPRTALAFVAGLAVVSSTLGGCKDEGKANAQAASENLAIVATTAASDVGEIDRGLPEGAKRLAPLFAKGDDPRSNPPQVRKELQRIRRDVPDLLVAKSTFFALTDDKGVAIRNDLEQDAMANLNLAQIFPALSKALAGEYVTTTGAFPGPPGAAGPDKDWIAAIPVKKDDGKVAGMLVTGWTYRSFSRHLQEILKRDLSEKLRVANDNGKLPVIYVGVFDPSGVYFAPLTPKVNEEEMAKLKLPEKTAGGAVSSPIVITGRTFGWAARRVDKLGPDAGVVVLRSDL